MRLKIHRGIFVRPIKDPQTGETAQLSLEIPPLSIFGETPVADLAGKLVTSEYGQETLVPGPVKGWAGIEIDGSAIPFTLDNWHAFVEDPVRAGMVWDCLGKLLREAQDGTLFLKNSASAPAGSPAPETAATH